MKKTFISNLAVIFSAFILMGFTPSEVQSKTTFVTIGTGGITGVYYPTGGAIAKMVNKKRKEYGIRATVESTGGSVFNVNAIMAGDLEFGVVQSDRQYQAVHGLAEWQEKTPRRGRCCKKGRPWRPGIDSVPSLQRTSLSMKSIHREAPLVPQSRNGRAVGPAWCQGAPPMGRCGHGWVRNLEPYPGCL